MVSANGTGNFIGETPPFHQFGPQGCMIKTERHDLGLGQLAAMRKFLGKRQVLFLFHLHEQQYSQVGQQAGRISLVA